MAAATPAPAPSGPSQLGEKSGPIITYKLFKSLHMGMGDANDTVTTRRMDEYYSPAQTTRRYNRIHGSMDARWPGQVRQGLRVSKIAAVNHDLTPVFAVEWTDTNGVYPAVLYIVGKKVMKVMFGSVTEVSTNMGALATNNATGGMFDDDGSGVPYLYACFGTAQNIVRMNRVQTFTLDSTGVTAGLLLSLNGDAYRTIQPTGGTATCQVSKCPLGKDRMNIANWFAGTTVGFAGTSINVLTAVRQAPVAIKPEGIFYYSSAYDRWVNAIPAWRNFQHQLNGIGAFWLGDQLVIPTGDGGSVIFDGTNVKEFDVGGLMNTPSKHTTKDKFSAMAALRHWIVGATKTGSKLESMGDSALFYYFDGTSYTDFSAQVRDLDLTTFTAFSLTTTGAIYIGWIRPFSGLRFEFGTAQINAATMTLAVGQANGTYFSVGAKNTGYRDATELNGAPLGQTGDIMFMTDPVNNSSWAQTVVNGKTAWWLKITTSANWTNAGIVNMFLQEWFPSIDYANFPLDGLDKSGVFPHLLYGREHASGVPIWHDICSIPEPDYIGAIVFANTGLSGSTMNHPRNLIAIGRFGVWNLQTGDNDRPTWETQPFANQTCLLEGNAVVPMQSTSDGKGRVVKLRTIRIFGHELDPNVTLHFYYSWEYGKTWSRGLRSMSLPIQFDYNEIGVDNNVGTRFRWALGFTGPIASVTSLAAVTDIEADFEVEPLAPIDKAQERPVRTLPRF